MIKMESKNDAPRIIIQLILGAFVYYIFTFKYKDILINNLSQQVYYQLLVIVVICNSYMAKLIDSTRSYLCHKILMFISNKYKAKHYKSETQKILEESKSLPLSDDSKKMIEEMSKTDIELESKVSSIYKEIKEFKKKKIDSPT